MVPSLGMEYLHKLFEILLPGDFSLLPIYLFIQSFSMSVWTHGYSFYTVGYNPVLFYFFILLKWFQPWPLGGLSVGSYIPLTYLY